MTTPPDRKRQARDRAMTAATRRRLLLRLAGVIVLGGACAGGTDAATQAARETTSAGPAAASRPASSIAVVPSSLPAVSTGGPASSGVAATPTTITTTTTVVSTTSASPPSTVTATPPSAPAGTPPSVPAPNAPWTVAPPRVERHTSCRQVAHIGDSTSEHLWDASTVGGDADATMEARYRDIGVEEVYNDTSGGRSMVERINARQRNALEVAEELRATGFRGCWVLMIGTNDAANVAAGANLGLGARIDTMLGIIGDDPVLWVNTASSSDIAWYGDDEMRAFNAALSDAAVHHPNLWVLDWASAVQPGWYGPDGLHHNPAGRAWRAALTADELAFAFPG